AVQLEGERADRKAVPTCPGIDARRDDGLSDLLDLPAVVADGEGCAALRGASAASASDVGVQRFEPVDVTECDQPIERPIDCWRCRDALMPQLLYELVGRARSCCLSQRREQDLLLGVQRLG